MDPSSQGPAMIRTGLRVSILLAAALAAGCGSTVRPYANDPLVRNGGAIRGDPTRSLDRDLYAGPGPLPPRPPYASSLAESGHPAENLTVQRAQIDTTFPTAP